MSNKNCNTGLDDRCRDENGEIRRKRSDTLVGTLRREYGENFAEGFRSDAKLGTVLRETSSNSLSLGRGIAKAFIGSMAQACQAPNLSLRPER
jgi:hypothetical protein